MFHGTESNRGVTRQASIKGVLRARRESACRRRINDVCQPLLPSGNPEAAAVASTPGRVRMFIEASRIKNWLRNSSVAYFLLWH